MKIDTRGKLVALAIPLGISISFLMLGLDVVFVKAVQFLFRLPTDNAAGLLVGVAIIGSVIIVEVGLSFTEAQTVTITHDILATTTTTVEYHQHLLLALSLIIAGVLFWFLLIAFYQDVYALL
jgi:hypothetical protein